MATYACINDNDGSWCGFMHRDKSRAEACLHRAKKAGIARTAKPFQTRDEIMRLPIHKATLDVAKRVAGTKEANRLKRAEAEGSLMIVDTPEPLAGSPKQDIAPRQEYAPTPADRMGTPLGLNMAEMERFGVDTEPIGAPQAPQPQAPQPQAPQPQAPKADDTPTGFEQLLDLRIDMRVAERLEGFKPEDIDRDAIIRDVNDGVRKDMEAMAKKVAESMTPQVVEIEINGDKLETPEGEFVHAAMADLITCYEMRDDAALIGPSGCGKTHAVEQLAKLRDDIRDWHCLSMSEGITEGQLFGKREPAANGEWQFVGTKVLDLFENGGVLLLGECDAADSNVLMVLQNALANGFLPVPNRPEAPMARRHPDFVCFIDMNTYGRGGNRMFVRNRLDAAFLDRFWQIEVDYDRELEKALVPNATWREWCWSVREACEEFGFSRNVSTRGMMRCAKRLAAVKTFTEKQARAQMLTGWKKDEIARLKSKGITVTT